MILYIFFPRVVCVYVCVLYIYIYILLMYITSFSHSFALGPDSLLRHPKLKRTKKR